MKNAKSFDTRKLVLLALLTAIVIVLQALSAQIRFGPFSITLALLPITIGAALIGAYAGAWLGLVFAAVILLSGDANVFLAINPAATIISILLRGLILGFVVGAVYRLIARKNKTAGAITAAVLSPIVNTGLFVAIVYLFFLPYITEWAQVFGFASTAAYVFLGMIGVNFLIEFAVNIVFCSVIVRLVEYGQDRNEYRRVQTES